MESRSRSAAAAVEAQPREAPAPAPAPAPTGTVPSCPVRVVCADLLDDLESPADRSSRDGLGSAVSQRRRSKEWPLAAGDQHTPPVLGCGGGGGGGGGGGDDGSGRARRVSWPPGRLHRGARAGLLVAEKAAPSKIFVDVGGNRELFVVMRLLDRLLTFDTVPSLIVVKNEELFYAMRDAGVEHANPAPSSVWPALPRYSPPPLPAVEHGKKKKKGV